MKTTTDTDRALRPQTLDEFTGQDKLCTRIRLAIVAARQRNEPLDHVLLHGPPGLGKTTLSGVIANEMGGNVTAVAAPAIATQQALIVMLLRLQARDVLFIDEIHGLGPEVEEMLYSAIEDYRICIPAGDKMATVQLQPFTLIGATTKAGEISGPLRSRFGIDLDFDFYADEHLAGIVAKNSDRLGYGIDQDAASLIGSRARGTPRIANRLLRRARDHAQVSGIARITLHSARMAMLAEGIDDNGLSDLDRAYLHELAVTYKGGPAGLNAIAATLDRDATTLVESVEPYLLRRRMIVRASRGRKITDEGNRACGVSAGEIHSQEYL